MDGISGYNPRLTALELLAFLLGPLQRRCTLRQRDVVRFVRVIVRVGKVKVCLRGRPGYRGFRCGRLDGGGSGGYVFWNLSFSGGRFRP